MIGARINIDTLIDVVKKGGKVRTGIDVFDSRGVLLLEKDVVVNEVNPLKVIKALGIQTLPISSGNYGGVWDDDGNYLNMGSASGDSEQSSGMISDAKTASMRRTVEAGERPQGTSTSDASMASSEKPTGEIEKRLDEINEIKRAAAEKYSGAKTKARKVLTQIKMSGGEFDYGEVDATVTQLIDFFHTKENPFAYLSRDLFGYNEYLATHCVNVCAVGSAMLNRFNNSFSAMINRQMATAFVDDESYSGMPLMTPESGPFRCYYKEDIRDITAGFFLHDIGKVLIPEHVLYKKGKLTAMEFDMIRKHSYQMGAAILEKNQLKNVIIENIVRFHHVRLFDNEKRSYPEDLAPVDIPPYVKMCKLADIYDAMISKQCYKEAHNPIGAVTDIFRKYADKDHLLQFILHAFVKSIGIYPTGSIIYLINGQMAYVLDSEGPLVLPFTDTKGDSLTQASDPLDIGEKSLDESLRADGFRTVQTPVDVYERLPSYLKSGLSHPS